MRLFFCVIAATAVTFAGGAYSNRRAPGFSLQDSHYEQHDPQDFRGKVWILDIMTTGCPTCKKLAETLVQVKAKYGEKIGMYSVVTMPDTHDTADRFAAEYKITWPILFDSGQVIMSYLKVTPSNPQVHFPHLFIVDGNGTIRNDFEGSEDKALTVEALSAEIDRLSKLK